MGANYYQAKSEQTDTIERLLIDGKHSLQSIASVIGVSRPRVSQIKKRMLEEGRKAVSPQTVRSRTQEKLESVMLDSMKALTIRFTPAVFDALAEACAISNRQNPDDTITIEDFIEECAVVKVVELGLLKQRRKK